MAEGAALATIRAYCGWHVTPVKTETLTVDGNGRREIQLPTGRITDITKVLNEGQDITSEIEWSTDGTLRWHRPLTTKMRGVQITLTHGWDEADVPDLMLMVRDIAARSTTAPAVNLMSANTAGPFTATLQTRPGGGAMSGPALFAFEKRALDTYRVVVWP